MKKIFCLCIYLFFTFNLFSAEEKKIALLFLTRSDLNHTQLWKDWIDLDLYNVYNHPKTTVSDPWLAEYIIQENQPTEWGYLILAQQALLKEALKNPSNFKFVFLSESCIPLWPTDHIYRILTSHGKSHMRWYGIWWKGDPNRTLTEFPIEHHFGNHQWIILNRKHAQMIAEDNYWIHLAMNHLCCDEAYPATFFSMQDVLEEFENELTTYVDMCRGPPYVFVNDTEENLNYLLDAKYNPNGMYGPRHCLFARKFSKDFPVNSIEFLIEFDNGD